MSGKINIAIANLHFFNACYMKWVATQVSYLMSFAAVLNFITILPAII
jgi:hypothetical protein